ncbi:TPA: hypothetical protein ACIJ2W_001770 [Pseudomonas aeruginosa]|uniref:hypothetical protein n=1 Tax=Pseudomonas aeruginosa TaxID=287 RepID=UPI000FEEB588|nr:hypothetical protein [Pseudomonas aeruginosa]RPO84910.1 hypothetical protein IPC1171_27095 [Pseudomonas aeruginosa]HCF7691174.1 hypothetical protein [Pseudomonas aeruginosa]HCL3533876.1 hypothetical protein [Pseudomonas aeruginosa]HCL3656686.1 hypothetical protein [Pseudomonas aeruginosa]
MIEMKPEAWKITGSRTWCDKVVEIEDRADRSIQERDDGSFKVPLYAIHAGHVVVSEALLRRLARPADRYDEVFTLDRHEAAEELRALLSEQA